MTTNKKGAAATASRRRGARVQWTDDEWLDLAQQIVRERAAHPKEILTNLAEAAQRSLIADGKWDAGRFRKIASPAMLDRAIPIIKDIEADRDRAVANYEQYRRALAKVATKDDVLNHLSDEEVRAHFGQRLLDAIPLADITKAFPPEELLQALPLDQVVGIAAARLVREWQEREVTVRHLLQREASVGAPAERPATLLPTVILVGFQPDVFQRMRERFGAEAKLLLFDLDRLADRSARGAQWVMAWGDRLSKAQWRMVRGACQDAQLPASRCVRVLGGQATLQRAIEKALADEAGGDG